ncbi:HNH endonuclease [Chondrinema litorale]|uniref:HNH endonuclease n=1 Tax=Chondrinema litorale TaxID=2994555 RepID=UPI0025432517|nr:HNH endonuclease signature motif containing protein [Chondrinema litorale]UZS00255.1 HNH endonuclease signature motif containing protein [Chondrinema litorale]
MARIVKKPRWWDKKATTGKQEGRKEKSKNYNTTQWRTVRDAVKVRDKYLCQECLRNNIYTQVGIKPNDYAVDHKRRVREGGDFFDMDNLELLCSTCHNSKSGKERWEGDIKG